MGDFLTVLWRMSWQASIIILVVVALRKIYELLHIEKKYVMLLWIIPVFCLICPLKISVPHGFWQDSVVELSYVQEDVVVQLGDSYKAEKSDTVNGNDNIKFEVVAPDNRIGNNTSKNYKLTIDYKFLMTNILGILWLTGVVALLIWNIISYKKLRDKLICSNKVDDNVYKGDEVESPIAFEEGNVKKRIVNIVRYKKTVTVLSICAVFICIILAGVFVTKDKAIVEGKVVDTQDDINRDAFNAYTKFINQVEAAILDDFQSVSADELGISKAFEDGIDLNSYRIGYQIYDTNADGVLDLMFVAEDRYSGIRLLFDNYTYENGEIIHRNSSTVGIATSGGEFFKFAVPQEPKATEVPVTEAPSTEIPETEESVNDIETIVDMQIVNMASEEVALAFDAYKSVLKNEATFINSYDNESLLLTEWNEDFNNGAFDLSSFAVIDLDGEGIPEIVIAHQSIPDTEGRIADASDVIQDIGYMILRYNEGKVYSYYRYNRGFSDLKIDGRFISSGGASNYGICKLSFEGNKEVVDEIDYVESYYDEYPLEHTNYYVNKVSTTAEHFNRMVDKHTAKPDVTWYILSEENIEALGAP